MATASSTYYVNTRTGSDNADGLTPETAWRTVDHVNHRSFDPGDRILFHRGDVYHETLAPASSGASGNPIEFGAYGAGANPVFRGDGQSEVIDVSGVDYIRLSGLDVTHGKRGLLLENTTGSEVIDCRVYGNNRDGIYIGHDAHDNLVQGGSSHDNGEVDAKYSDNQGRMINLGHGVLINTGAHHNTVDGMKLYANAEDGVQFGNSAGGGNVLRDSRMYDNLEDGVDIKRGSQTLIGNEMHGNTNNAVNIHNDSGVITLTGNDLRTETGANALDVREGARVISTGNRYEGVNSYAVELSDNAGDHSTFHNDLFVDGGRNSKISVDVRAGDGHLFENVVFVMRNSGHALAVRDGAGTVTLRNVDFYIDGDAMKITAGKHVNTSDIGYFDVLKAGAILAADPLVPDDSPAPEPEPDPEPDPQPEPDPDPQPDPEPDPQPEPDPDPQPDPEPDPDSDPTPVPTPGNSQDPDSGHIGMRLSGDDGRDRLDGGAAGDELHGLANDDRLFSHDGDDTLFGGTGEDHMFGDRGLDRLFGEADNDKLYGGDGNDALHGGDGRDQLRGDSGDDVIDGGDDRDQLWGGDGHDTFVFRAGEVDGDRIRDFDAGQDVLQFEGFGDATFSNLNDERWLVEYDGGSDVIRLEHLPSTADVDYLFVA